MKEDLLKIINHYGIDKQLKYIHSEYFELDEAILNYEYNTWDFDEIAQEIADIMVMLKQFQYYYKISDEEIENIMKFKIDRQLKRMEDEQNNNS